MAKKKETEAADVVEDLESAREKFGDVVENKIRGLKGGIKDGAGKASQAVKEKAGAVTASARETFEGAQESARETYEGARERAREGYDKVTKDLDHLGTDVNDYVRHNPGKAIAMAAGAGFVLGLLLRGRRD